MRISDWSSDVCSSDLRDARSDRCGKFLHFGIFGRADDVSVSDRPAVIDPDIIEQAPYGLDVGIVGPCRRRRERRDQNQHGQERSEEHTSELQSLMRISYAVFCLKKNTNT